MSRIVKPLRKLAGFFIADPFLALLVPLWIAILWEAARLTLLPHAALAALLAGGPIALLWWSVRQAARAMRANGSRATRADMLQDDL